MIGIITFHGSHNYGSMLQAYATQQAINKLGFKNEIINFRMKSQKEFYSLYPSKYGVMRFCRSLLMFPIQKHRKNKMVKFESFLNKRLILSGRELETYDDLKNVSNKYDIYLSGSDQIWSDLTPEIVASKTDYTGVYFLNFVEGQKKKISYASSVGEISYNNLAEKKELLSEYSTISTREKQGSDMVGRIIGKKVETVIDPTFLLTNKEWRKIMDVKPLVEGKYIFLYTLRGIRPGIKWARHLKNLAKRFGLKIVCVAPFFPVASLGLTNLTDVGPEDFLNLIANAQVVFTDSFHGTALSINFNKPFYSLNKSDSKDMRKVGVLDALGLHDRSLSSFEDIDNINSYEIDYTEANEKLDELRETSFTYLKKAIAGDKTDIGGETEIE